MASSDTLTELITWWTLVLLRSFADLFLSLASLTCGLIWGTLLSRKPPSSWVEHTRPPQKTPMNVTPTFAMGKVVHFSCSGWAGRLLSLSCCSALSALALWECLPRNGVNTEARSLESGRKGFLVASSALSDRIRPQAQPPPSYHLQGREIFINPDICRQESYQKKKGKLCHKYIVSV